MKSLSENFFGGVLWKLKEVETERYNVQGECNGTHQPHPPHTYHVLAAGSLLGVYSILDIVNLHSPVAPTRLQNPPSGTRELKNDDN